MLRNAPSFTLNDTERELSQGTRVSINQDLNSCLPNIETVQTKTTAKKELLRFVYCLARSVVPLYERVHTFVLSIRQ